MNERKKRASLADWPSSHSVAVTVRVMTPGSGRPLPPEPGLPLTYQTMRASTSSGSTGSNQVPPEPNSRFSRATPVPPMAQAMVVGMDQTIICCFDVGDPHHAVDHPEQAVVEVTEEERPHGGGLGGQQHVDPGDLRQDGAEMEAAVTMATVPDPG